MTGTEKEWPVAYIKKRKSGKPINRKDNCIENRRERETESNERRRRAAMKTTDKSRLIKL